MQQERCGDTSGFKSGIAAGQRGVVVRRILQDQATLETFPSAMADPEPAILTSPPGRFILAAIPTTCRDPKDGR